MKYLVGTLFILFSLAGGSFGTQPPAVQVQKQPAVQQVRPQKPVKIKLHRTPNGEYSWDLTGDNVDEIVRADRRLRKLLNLDQNKPE